MVSESDLSDNPHTCSPGFPEHYVTDILPRVTGTYHGVGVTALQLVDTRLLELIAWTVSKLAVSLGLDPRHISINVTPTGSAVPAYQAIDTSVTPTDEDTR